ncbi:preprotein translocase subunit YajC [Campylobacter fetus]|uniref:Sec translocon accessory complex subunit YajC n=1 Tax=Campylobacter fetus subsp. testudinum TaxID=1507806 RepID=A0AAX0HC51_CAMFE|nr:preprotein translocase subunit YajC [Campylobacter fetus]AGZ81585.1 preprotein translocase subunit YajC [Campylobacter fetus subsp. testudinum 03-427]AJB45327.1 preprotein translocase subunit YajC [Campylobacter fetus subsp. testudinum]ALV64745.1 preprotein translocase subunit YajC [Campylobacter fetus subsp. testudinum Sp3]AVK80993.1 preprotein translocase subunit YajC [Campylobacter fetus subsp. testudinum]EAI4321438.1 preprotein translocase subunit YajC [Campylobacter fetus]
MPEIVTSLLPLIVLFAIFYFLVIRPQQKQQKEHRNMLSNLQKGDKIVTNGGLFCEVVKPEDDFIKVKLNDEVIVRIDRNFVAKKIDKIEKSDA